MIYRIAVIVSLMCLLVGCMGRPPHHVDTFQYGDDKRSCEETNREIIQINETIEALYQKRDNKIGGNVMVAAVGVLVFPPLLFLADSRSDELTEISSYLDRRRTLCSIVRDQKCRCSIETNEEFLARIDRKSPAMIREPQKQTHTINEEQMQP